MALLAMILLCMFVLINVVGTWYFVRATSVDPRFPMPAITGNVERFWFIVDWLSLLLVPSLLSGAAAVAAQNPDATGFRNFLYGWLLGRIVAPVIAPEEDDSIDEIGLLGYLAHRYQEFGRSLFMAPFMQILVLVAAAWVMDWILWGIGMREILQESFDYLLPVAGIPIMVQGMTNPPTLTPMPAAGLMAFALILNIRLAPIGLARTNYVIGKTLVALVAGTCLLGRTQLFSGVEYSAWPDLKWFELTLGLVALAVGTIPPLTIAFFQRRGSGSRAKPQRP
ncbi:hypothetical protein [Sinorhizobium mexicanum]|uniref:Uncharacterized protein n=1 Tax=Sinorhizobium mexicanum TaxID=375549 RepID=A0A859QG11_9HYPH|nr:hypothetical protein [Sinorhizobium mexicanum]MBP1884991.1 hypothetical protein [Sinorhizobium mexicanum]QLL64272.1 hypothetical protein FKV68_22760 [Sinorhizobium mexicanum]